jgi:8-oxo-dGTP pyrophosphatase MutT (NUDIX family)
MHPASSRDGVFVCYSRKDERWRQLITEWLRPVQDTHPITVWSDKNIDPGTEYFIEIDNAIAHARIALLLVSASFLASDFIMKEELPRILAARSRGLTVLWVPTSRSIWQGSPIAPLQAVLEQSVFLDEMAFVRRQRALQIICEAVLNAFTAKTRVPTPAPAQVIASSPEDLTVTYRHDSETKGGDSLLRSASEARFIAMTYKTLGLAFTEGHLRLLELRKVELAAYALPILKNWHPTLTGSDIEAEWKLGITRALTALANGNVASDVANVDLRIINRVPTFTATLLTGKSNGRSIMRIRYTQILDKVEPSATPTMNIALDITDGKEVNPVFDAYARIIDNMQSDGRPLLFPIKRTNPVYVREDIEGFVGRLQTVTNHHDYGLPDAEFQVRAKIDAALFGQLSIPRPSTGTTMHPDDLYVVFDALRAAAKADGFRVRIDFTIHQIAVEVSLGNSEEWLEWTVEQKHKVGVFALLVKRIRDDCAVFLKSKEKPAWSHDVPGGKVAQSDGSMEETLEREVFEELGLVMRRANFGGVIAAKYDPRGSLTQGPVIAIYHRYTLGTDESRYLEEVLPNATDGYAVIPYKVQTLVDQKRSRRPVGLRFPQHDASRSPDPLVNNKDKAEAVCHAPLDAILKLLPAHAAGSET